MKKTIGLVVVFLMFTSSAARSAAPSFIPLQGMLTDAQGNAINGDTTMHFAIYDTDTAATPLWSETQSVYVDNGFFTVYLGQDQSLDLRFFRDNSNLWLGISVESDPDMDRVYLGSTPFSAYAEYCGYAENAGDAQTLGGFAASDFRANSDPMAWSDLTGIPADFSDGDADTLGGLSCSSGQVAKWNGSAWACAADDNTDTVGGLSCGTGEVAKWDGTAWACAADNNTDTLGGLSCASGQVAKWNGSAWNCVDDIDTQLTQAEVDAMITNRLGTTYIRWGRSVCPAGAELVYDGYAAGKHYTHGGGTNLLCLSKSPTWGAYDDGSQGGNLVYGVEYKISGTGLASSLGGLHDQDAPCAVCYAPSRSVTTVIQGRNLCPASWTQEYQGYLMSNHYTQGASETVCVDRSPEGVPGGAAAQGGSWWYPTEAECGSLPCAPYVQNRELTCAVCTR